MRLTQEYLKSLLHYDPETGEFRWNARRPRIHVGMIAGTINKKGYRIIEIDGKGYPASKLAWFYTYGEWPPYCVDHKNRREYDDSLNNLRPATNGQNQANKIGYGPLPKGITKRSSGKYRARISANKQRIDLGTFDTLEEAEAAYDKEATRIFGEYHYKNGG
jgi:Demerecviridae HNH endonuclease